MYATSKAEQEQPYHFASLPVPQADIDFFSDTKTKPTDEMRTAMATAEVRVPPAAPLPAAPFHPCRRPAGQAAVLGRCPRPFPPTVAPRPPPLPHPTHLHPTSPE